MNKSSEINELAESLSKFLGEVKDAYKDKAGYKFDYADLSSVLEIARPLLAKNALAVTQMPSSGTDGECIVETVLMHKSGQWMSSQLKMPVVAGKNNELLSQAQLFGMTVTYCRRYSLAAVLGITQSDTDASLIGDDADAAIADAIEDAKDKAALSNIWKEIDGKSKRRFQKRFDERLAEIKAK